MDNLFLKKNLNQKDAHVRRWANYNWYDLIPRYEKYQDTKCW